MKLESSHFCTDAYSIESRFDVYREAIGAIFDIDLNLEKISTLKAEYKTYLMDNIVFADCMSTAHRFSRNEKKIAECGYDHFLVQIFIEGQTVGLAKNEGSVGKKGAIFFIDCARPWLADNTKFRAISLIIPRAELAHRITGLSFLHAHQLRTECNPFAKIFENFVIDLYQNIVHIEKEGAHVLSRNCIDLLASALRFDSPHKFGECRHDNMIGPQIKHYIEKHLEDPSLDVKALMKKFSLSRASLYRLFPENTGGVRSFIGTRRMNKAYLTLMNKGDMMSITEVAYACGFKSISSFSRSFKERFGLSPQDMLHLWRDKHPKQKELELVRWGQWLKLT